MYCLPHTCHFLGAVMVNKTECLLCGGNSHRPTFMRMLVLLSFTCFSPQEPLHLQPTLPPSPVTTPTPVSLAQMSLPQRIPLSPKTLSTFLLGSHIFITDLKYLKLKSFLFIFSSNKNQLPFWFPWSWSPPTLKSNPSLSKLFFYSPAYVSISISLSESGPSQLYLTPLVF